MCTQTRFEVAAVVRGGWRASPPSVGNKISCFTFILATRRLARHGVDTRFTRAPKNFHKQKSALAPICQTWLTYPSALFLCDNSSVDFRYAHRDRGPHCCRSRSLPTAQEDRIYVATTTPGDLIRSGEKEKCIYSSYIVIFKFTDKILCSFSFSFSCVSFMAVRIRFQHLPHLSVDPNDKILSFLSPHAFVCTDHNDIEGRA